MLGFYGRAEGEDPKPDGEEISDARWFSRADLAAAIETRELIVPPSVAISRRLIEGWYGSELPVTP
jgi:NAD+ diphosphatase